MCLHIHVKTSKKMVEKVREKGKPIVAYKTLLREGKSFRSPYQCKMYRPNKTGVYKSNRNSVDLTTGEHNSVSIFYGLHFYKSRAVARGRKCWGEVIVKFEIQPGDLVAYGTCLSAQAAWGVVSELVAMKAKMIGVVW